MHYVNISLWGREAGSEGKSHGKPCSPGPSCSRPTGFTFVLTLQGSGNLGVFLPLGGTCIILRGSSERPEWEMWEEVPASNRDKVPRGWGFSTTKGGPQGGGLWRGVTRNTKLQSRMGPPTVATAWKPACPLSCCGHGRGAGEETINYHKEVTARSYSISAALVPLPTRKPLRGGWTSHLPGNGSSQTTSQRPRPCAEKQCPWRTRWVKSMQITGGRSPEWKKEGGDHRENKWGKLYPKD